MGDPSKQRIMGRRAGAAVSGATTVLACLVVWLALVMPNDIGRITPGAFVRIPLAGLVIVAVALVLGRRAQRTVAVLVGTLLGLLVVVKALDMGFLRFLDRPFDPVNDWGHLRSALGVLGSWIGQAWAVVVAAAAALLAVAVVVLVPLSVLRLFRLVARHRKGAVRTVAALGIVWVLCAVLGVQIAPQTRVASVSAAGLAYAKVGQVRPHHRDQRAFAQAIATDRFADIPADQLLSALRGKDVLFVFVESYGRIALTDPLMAPQVSAVLAAGTRRLRAAGYHSRSAFLTSPTFGGLSWLAHATLQSGLWVDTQRRYDQLITADRLTLTQAFERAGWRTVFVVPANTRDWPAGQPFYHFDKLYDSRNLGYQGPKFGYATMPDQYTLSAFRRRELTDADRTPVMAEIDLISSHIPWTPLPHLVDWDRVGDGSIFDGMAAAFEGSDNQRILYRESIEYSLRTLISFILTYPDHDRVIVMLGDHQPYHGVTGQGVTHDVPITIIAHDPAVMRRISDWGWQPGMKPGPDAPVWRMDAFRNRFFTAFSSLRGR